MTPREFGELLQQLREIEDLLTTGSVGDATAANQVIQINQMATLLGVDFATETTLAQALAVLNIVITQQIDGTQKAQVTNFPASQPVTGNWLTDTQLRATPVPVSGAFFQAIQPVSWTAQSVRMQDGSGNNINSTSNALNVNVTNTVTVSGSVTVSGTVAVSNAFNLEATQLLVKTDLDSILTNQTNNTQIVKIGNGATTATFTGTSLNANITNTVTVSGTVAVSNTSFNATGTSTPTDTFTNPTTAILSQSFLMGWNGTTWDRLKSTTANGLQVDVTRVTGTVTVSGSVTVSGTVAATQSGTWNINNISGTISLPTGAATSANQTNGSQLTQVKTAAGGDVFKAFTWTVKQTITTTTAVQVGAATGLRLIGFEGVNTGGSAFFIKFYDQAGAPTNADTPFAVYQVPNASTASYITDYLNNLGVAASNLWFRITRNGVDNDNTTAANTVYVRIAYST